MIQSTVKLLTYGSTCHFVLKMLLYVTIVRLGKTTKILTLHLLYLLGPELGLLQFLDWCF